ncbi:uncharacterized protein HGUI_01275 [Hanseniaspora guilliermondii]|uniref:LDB19 N-terminal domain-containing protein n=1 Tax=Hanseniaspora guilliermondii TaxID=56406 RepID=A0A1L0B2C6_9ASCO|nr:uncharacterized protein HGUI_01275 [Hanseniaspora guilliermondii]
MNFHKLKLSSSNNSKPKNSTNDNLIKNLSLNPDKNVTLDINIESPPCTLYGTTINSTGCLLSGILAINVLNDVLITNINMSFVQNVKYNQPHCFNNCQDCKNKSLTLFNWSFLEDNKNIINKGLYSYPFSKLLSGKLPQSTKINNSIINYLLIVDLEYTLKNKPTKVNLTLPIQITHAILRGVDKNSNRIFPPTTISASCNFPNVIYPKSIFPLSIRLEGITNGNKRWRMRKLNYKIEEKVKLRKYACKNHFKDLKNLEDEQRIKIKNEKSALSSDNPRQARIMNQRKQQQQLFKKNNNDNSIVNDIIIDDDVLNDLFNQPNTQNVENNEENQENTQNYTNVPADSFNNLYSTQNFPLLPNLDPTASFEGLIHPNDYQMRQMLINHQNQQRNWQIQQEKNSNCSLYTEEIRVLTQKTLKNGWKSDFNTPINHKNSNACGAIELITDINCMSLNSGIFAIKKSASSQYPQDLSKYMNYVENRNVKMICDIEDPILGLYVSHILSIEMVIAEEIIQNQNGSPIINNTATKANTINVPTGAARILRMQFRLNFSERSGMGIPWDDEVPPFYDDIKFMSPPLYSQTSNNQHCNPVLINQTIEDIDYDKLETEEDVILEEDENKDELYPLESIYGNVEGTDMFLSPNPSIAPFRPL